jgi:hypothetical protein
MRKLAVSLSMSVLVSLGNALPLFAGGQFFASVGGGPEFFPRAGFAFHPHGFFVQFGRQPFIISPFAQAPWGSYYPPAMSIAYPVSPQEIPQQSFSGTDSQGVLYVDGYRVLPSGWLRVHVEPTDAEVLVDGFPISINSASGVSSSLGFPVGKHHVRVRRAGFQEFHSEVVIMQAREFPLEIRLSQ